MPVRRQSASSRRSRAGDELRGFDRLSTPDEVWDRAADVQALLIVAGNWRALSIVDLVIAGVAERHHTTVLHYDGDFDMIAADTGQPTQWVVTPGSARNVHRRESDVTDAQPLERDAEQWRAAGPSPA